MNRTEQESKELLLKHGLDMRGTFERNLTWEAPVRIFKGAHLDDVSLGAYSYVAPKTEIAHASIGRFCSIGDNTLIRGSAHPTQWLSSHPFSYQNIYPDVIETSPPLTFDGYGEMTRIGHDVWIGARAIILPGVTIGYGAVIGAGAVVAKDVPAYAVVVGNPGRVVKYRFDEPTMERLLKSQWWRFDLPRMLAADPSLPVNDPLAMLDMLERQTLAVETLNPPKRQLLKKDGKIFLRDLAAGPVSPSPQP